MRKMREGCAAGERDKMRHKREGNDDGKLTVRDVDHKKEASRR
jgi:hypothetical protein